MTGSPDLSVVVACYNGAAFLPKCLASLCRQVGADFEVIVVDDGSTDDTWEQIQKFDVVGVRLPENRGLSAARNAGIARATGEVIAFVDDDEVAPDGWAAQIVSFWKNAPSGVAFLCGFASPLTVDTFNRKFAEWHRPFMPTEQLPEGSGQVGGRIRRYLQSVSRSSLGSGRPISRAVGCAMSLRRADLQQLGGFAEEIRFGGEDDELSVRVLERFGTDAIWFDPSIELLHDFGAAFRSTLRRFYLYGRGEARRFAKERGVPALQPMPVLAIAVGITAGLVRPRLGVATAIAVPYMLTARRWVPALRRDGPKALVYPMALLSLEIAADVGLMRGLASGTGPRQGSRSAVG